MIHAWGLPMQVQVQVQAQVTGHRVLNLGRLEALGALHPHALHNALQS